MSRSWRHWWIGFCGWSADDPMQTDWTAEHVTCRDCPKPPRPRWDVMIRFVPSDTYCCVCGREFWSSKKLVFLR